VVSCRRLRGFTALCALCAGLTACANAEITPDAGVDGPPPPDAPPPDAPPPDAAISMGFFLDDVAADFTAGTLADAVIEPWGAIAPRAYYTGGLRVRGSDTGIFLDAVTATWTQVEGMTFTGTEAPGRALTWDTAAATPPGVALTAADDLTLAYDGEIFLEAGTWTFHVLADDHAFLELAPIGTTTFTRVASANWMTEATGTFIAAAPGWYPVRLAHCEQGGATQLRVEMSGPAIPSRAPVPRHRLRFSVSGTTGLVVGGFDDARMLGDHATSIDRVGPAARAWNTGLPADLGIINGDDFAVRWAGQLRIDVAGDFTFRYTTDDGQRLWVNGALLLDAWDDNTHDATTAAVFLDRGWHDLVIDHTEATGGAQAFLGVSSGPELVGAMLPADRLRPVEARAERYDTGVDHADRSIPDLGQLEAPVRVDAPAGAKTRGVDVGWVFDHPYRGDLEIWLVAPDGSATLLRDHVGGGASGVVTERMYVTALDETNAAGTWHLRVRDTVSLDAGTLRDFSVTVHHQGGTPPITPAASYTSPVKDLGDMVTEYTSFGWQARMNAGTAVKLYVRSGESQDALLANPWSSPLLDPSAGAPPVIPRRYFQYRIDLESDGDGSAMVDWVRLDTRREIP
jgi:subtilisin-like proprotein convertase family protein